MTNHAPTHCATCPINVGCSWGCLRGDDLAEIAILRYALTAAIAAIEDCHACRSHLHFGALEKARAAMMLP